MANNNSQLSHLAMISLQNKMFLRVDLLIMNQKDNFQKQFWFPPEGFVLGRVIVITGHGCFN
jgi:hypothetical protein